MKTIKNLSLWLLMLTMSVCMTSCGSDDEELVDEIFKLEGTRWVYTDVYEEDGIEYTENNSLIFSTSTATYQLEITIKEGSTSTSTTDYRDYTYDYSDGLVVLTPVKANVAYLEGKITSNLKMEVKNVSTGRNIGVFYKK